MHTDLDFWPRPDHRRIVKVLDRLPPGSRYDASLLIGTRLLNLQQFTPIPNPHAKLGKDMCGMVMIKTLKNNPKHKSDTVVSILNE